VLYLQRAASSTFQTCILYSQSVAAEIGRGKKEEDRRRRKKPHGKI